MKIPNYLIFLITVFFKISITAQPICAPNDPLFRIKRIFKDETIDEIVYVNGRSDYLTNNSTIPCGPCQVPYYNRQPRKCYNNRRKSLTTLGQGTTLTLLARGAAAPTGRVVGLEGAIDIIQ